MTDNDRYMPGDEALRQEKDAEIEKLQELLGSTIPVERALRIEIDRLRSLLQQVLNKANKGELVVNPNISMGGGIYTFWDQIQGELDHG